MNPLLELFIERGLLFDLAGVMGLGLIALAALKLARKGRSWGGNLMAAGAVSLLLARVFIITSPHFMTRDVQEAMGPVGLALAIGLPPLLLTFGLAGVVWGLWGHERWLREMRR